MYQQLISPQGMLTRALSKRRSNGSSESVQNKLILTLMKGYWCNSWNTQKKAAFVCFGCRVSFSTNADIRLAKRLGLNCCALEDKPDAVTTGEDLQLAARVTATHSIMRLHQHHVEHEFQALLLTISGPWRSQLAPLAGLETLSRLMCAEVFPG